VKLSYATRDSYGNSPFGNTESGEGASNPDWTQAFWFISKAGTGQVMQITCKNYAHEKWRLIF
jgi:hypothetical protein